jgi:hypothetical protein
MICPPSKPISTRMSSVDGTVMSVEFWRARSAPGKDAWSGHMRNMGATEDTAWRS